MWSNSAPMRVDAVISHTVVSTIRKRVPLCIYQTDDGVWFVWSPSRSLSRHYTSAAVAWERSQVDWQPTGGSDVSSSTRPPTWRCQSSPGASHCLSVSLSLVTCCTNWPIEAALGQCIDYGQSDDTLYSVLVSSLTEKGGVYTWRSVCKPNFHCLATDYICLCLKHCLKCIRN